MYKIEKGVPLRFNNKEAEVFSFAKMKVNDSFFVPTDEENKVRKRTAVYNALYKFQRNNPGRKFTTRSFENGLRVWRTK